MSNIHIGPAKLKDTKSMFHFVAIALCAAAAAGAWGLMKDASRTPALAKDPGKAGRTGNES